MSTQQNEHNQAGLLTFVVSMVFTFVFFIYISFIHPGVELEKVKGLTPETQMKMAGGEGGEKGAAGSVANNETPWISSEAMIAHGKSVYQTNCAFCHGAQGKGDGAAGATLVPKPRNLVKGDWKNGGSTVGLFKTLKNGIAGTSMAAFGHLPLVDRWAMVHYIQDITENKIITPKGELEAFAKAEK